MTVKDQRLNRQIERLIYYIDYSLFSRSSLLITWSSTAKLQATWGWVWPRETNYELSAYLTYTFDLE